MATKAPIPVLTQTVGNRVVSKGSIVVRLHTGGSRGEGGPVTQELFAFVDGEQRLNARWIAAVGRVKKKTLALCDEHGVVSPDTSPLLPQRGFIDKSYPGVVTESQSVVHLYAEEAHRQHLDFGCDACLVRGNQTDTIQGSRYFCTTCGNVDFCDDCLREDPSLVRQRHRECAKEIFGEEYVEEQYGIEDHLLVEKRDKSRRLTSLHHMTLWENLAAAFKNAAGLNFVAEFEDESFTKKWTTYTQMQDMAVSVGSGLRRYIDPGEVVAVFSSTSVEYMATDFACVSQGFLFVPVHTTLSAETLRGVFGNAKPSVLFCSPSHKAKLASLVPEVLAAMKLIVLLPEKNVALVPEEKETSFAQLMAEGKTLQYSPVNVAPTDVCSICYTSGSSGAAKGTIFTHTMMHRDTWRALHSTPHPFVTLLYQPLTHMMGRNQVWDTLMCNGQIGMLYQQDMKHLYRCAQRMHITRIGGVPSVWNSLMAEYNTEVQGLTKEQIVEVNAKYNVVLGTRLQKVGVGSAKVPPHMLDFLRKIFYRQHIEESYGSTEVGHIAGDGVLDVDFKLEDVPELGYFKRDIPNPRGELLVKTADQTPGYYNSPELNEQFFDADGYFRTGDVVEVRDGRYVTVIDRRSNIVKLGEGEFVSPETLAGVFCKGSTLVDQVYVHINTVPSGVACVVYPSAHAVATQQDTPRAVLQSFLAVAEESTLPSHEHPAFIVISPTRFTPDNGMMTPSHKICRREVSAHFKCELEAGFASKERTLHDILRKLLSQEQSVGIDLKALGTDSLTYARLVHRMRKEQGIKITVAEAMGAASNHTCRDDVTHDFDTLAQFGPVAQPATLPHTPDCTPPEVVLLTGATGLVGGAFLERITTTNPDAAVVCLIRAASDSEAQSRLSEVCTQRGVSLTNVTTIAGDVASPHLGVAPEVYSRLQRKVTWVVHAAALVNWVLPYSKMRSANVIGTHNVLKFVRRAHLGPDLMHISTQSVTGEASLQSVLRLADEGKGYASTKEMAELLVERSEVEGAVVARCGFVGPHSLFPGLRNTADFVYRYCKSCITSGTVPKTVGSIAIEPADHLAMRIIASRKSNGATIELSSCTAVPWTTLGSAVVNGSCEVVSLEAFAARISESPEDPLYCLQSFLHTLDQVAEGGGGGGGEVTPERIANLYADGFALAG